MGKEKQSKGRAWNWIIHPTYPFFYSMFSSCSSVICVWCGASREGVILSIAIVSILLLPYHRRCSIYMLLPLPFVLWLDSNSRIITQPNTAWEISHSKALYTVLYL
jgi:hypothetical protein